MDRESLQAFNEVGAEKRAELYGIKAIFRGEEITVLESSSNPSLFQSVGGFREETQWRVRLASTIQPPPAVKEAITQLSTGRRFVIVSVVVAAPDDAKGQYHTVEAILP